MTKMAKILIVDDDRHFIQQVRTLLATFEWASDFVIRAEHVFPKLERDAFDLILLDINMPGTSGVTLLKQLKAHPEYHTIPMIMLTAVIDDHVLAACFAHGATDFITKPVKELVVHARIQSALTTQAYIQQIQHQKEALEEQAVELHHSNTLLQQEISKRRRVEEELKQHRDHLEVLVEKRTAELQIAVEQLEGEIIERKNAEEELERIFNLSPDLVGTGNLAGYFTKINSSFQQILGYEDEEFLAKPFIAFVHEEDVARTLAALGEAAGGNREIYIQNRYTCKDCSYEWIEWKVLALVEEDIFYAVGRNITGRRQAEEQIKVSLQEKEVLLKEIHHRVKNNLQVVASLLYLQSKRLPDGETRALFNDSRNRVKSMALVHETLYQSGNLSRLHFAVYIRNLVAHVFRSYRGSSGRITSKVNVNDISLSIEAAAPCGLIINELVSNALKYAFPGRKGEIRIDMDVDEHDQFVLIVSDNGIGFPQDMDFRETGSLGLKLVHSLIDQLDATIELQNDEGATFTIIFTEPKYAKRV